MNFHFRIKMIENCQQALREELLKKLLKKKMVVDKINEYPLLEDDYSSQALPVFSVVANDNDEILDQAANETCYDYGDKNQDERKALTAKLTKEKVLLDVSNMEFHEDANDDDDVKPLFNAMYFCDNCERTFAYLPKIITYNFIKDFELNETEFVLCEVCSKIPDGEDFNENILDLEEELEFERTSIEKYQCARTQPIGLKCDICGRYFSNTADYEVHICEKPNATQIIPSIIDEFVTNLELDGEKTCNYTMILDLLLNEISSLETSFTHQMIADLIGQQVSSLNISSKDSAKKDEHEEIAKRVVHDILVEWLRLEMPMTSNNVENSEESKEIVITLLNQCVANLNFSKSQPLQQAPKKGKN